MAKHLEIDTIEPVELGNVTQWISIRGAALSNPAILFLHGGPGTAQIMFSRKPQRELDEKFVVVNWDQRGAGRSYSKHLDAKDMTIETFVQDAEELVRLLLKRFSKYKLFLVGHSWGSIVGLRLACRLPHLFYAYVGVGQVVNMMRGEELSYRFTLEEAIRRGNKKATTQLTKIGPPPYRDLASAGIQRDWLQKFNGATYQGSALGTLLRNTSIKDSSLRQIYKFVRGIMFSLKCLEDEQMKVDFSTEIDRLEVPVSFCCGRRDYNVPFELVVEFSQRLIAPHVEVVWFDKSGHLPNFEEPKAFVDFCVRMREQVEKGSPSS
jgi:pimeloyl-ACP methyl ester carboxylesterase